MHISKTLMKNVITYLVVLILPLSVLTFYFHTYLIQRFQSMTYEKEKNSYKNIAMEIDQQIGQIKGMATQLSTNPEVLAYNLDNDIVSKRRMITMLKYSLSVSDTIKDILMIDENQNIYASTGSYTLKTYSEIYRLPLPAVYDTINDNDSLSLHYIYPVYLKENSKTNTIYLACNYPFSSPYPSGKLIFRIDAKRFSHISDCAYSVYYDGLLVSENQRTDAPLSLESADTAADINNSSIRVEYGRVTLIAEIDSKAVFQDFYILRNHFTAIEIILTFISLLLISFFCYNNYQPLRKLKDTVSRLGNNIGIPGDDHIINSEIYSSIKFLEILASNNKQLDDKLLKEKYNSSELWLSRLLNHQYKNIDDILIRLREHDIILESGQYAVCIFKCSSPITWEHYPLADAVKKDLTLYFCHYTETRAAAIIGGNNLTKTQLLELIRIILQLINKQGILAEAYLGPLYTDADSINLSYIQAVSMIDYDPVQNGELHLYNFRDVLSNPLRYPLTEINNLSKAILKKDFITFDTIMQALMGQIANTVCDYAFARTTIYTLIKSTINSLPSESDSLLNELQLCLTKLEHSDCKADLITLMENFYVGISRQIKTVTPLETQEKIDAAIAYINDHYDDIDFFLGNVAERFDISNNNLSQQFKRKFGVTPIKYVTSLRIEKAKKLLLETSLPVNDIAVQCGFLELTSFLRNFKSLTVVTPTQYRNANKKDF